MARMVSSSERVAKSLPLTAKISGTSVLLLVSFAPVPSSERRVKDERFPEA